MARMSRSGGQSAFATVHPLLSLLYFLLLLGASMLLRHPLYLGAILLALLSLHWTTDRCRTLGRSLPGIILIALMSALMNPFFSSRGATILFYVLDRQVTLESILYGGLFGLSMMNTLIGFSTLNLIMTPRKLLYLLSPIAPRSTFAVMVAMRFVPLLMRRLTSMMSVYRTLGRLRKGKPRRQRMREGMDTLHTLLTWSLEDALQTAVSMRARGYGTGKRSSYTLYRMDDRDKLLAFIIVPGIVNLGAGWMSGLAAYTVYPIAQPLDFSAAAMLHLAVFTLLLIIPTVLNGKELLHWSIIRSRM